MNTKTYRLGELIQISDKRNTDLKYGIDDVKGISIQKIFIETKADMTNVSLFPYILVEPDFFCYVPVTSRNGEKITLAHNTTNNTYIVSSSYTVFRVIAPEILDSDYLFMYFNRPEFDRFARFNSWGSARETFSWQDLCDISITLPPLSVQKKYVDIYKSMVDNQKEYKKGIDNLKLVCFSSIENLKKDKKVPQMRIGDFVEPYYKKNIDGLITLEQGINIEKKFITPQRSNSNLEGRKIVRTGQIAYCTQLNNANVAVAYREGPDCVVSSVYDVIEIKDKKKLNPLYLMIWLIRPEFGRFVYWSAWGSAYEFLYYENLADYKIPIPDIHIQESIANIYKVYIERKRIGEQLKKQIKDLCPILIKGSIEEADGSHGGTEHTEKG